MPPKVKITREMILNAALALTREQGFEAVNARNIAAELECSTRPIFTAYQNMEEMKEDFLEFAYSFYCFWGRCITCIRSKISVRPLEKLFG